MNKIMLCLLFYITVVIKVTLPLTLEEDVAFQIHNKTETGKTLSRKKRYLVFPEGSSLQLVYCLTMPSIGAGQIFTIGSTAALAWELPHDPYVPFRRPSEVLHRIDKPEKYSSGGWTIQNGKRPVSVSNMKTYYNPFLINKPTSVLGYSTINSGTNIGPGYSTIKQNQFSWVNAKRKGFNAGVNSGNFYRSNSYSAKQHKQPFQQQSSDYQPITTYLHPVYHQVHRRTRRDLYTKVEKLFTALSKDGKACLLKAVCEVSQASQKKGTFMEEIIKAIFRVKPHDDYKDEDDYDRAANKLHNCTEKYPGCEHSVWTSMF